MVISSVGLDEKRIGNLCHGLDLTVSALRYEVLWCITRFLIGTRGNIGYKEGDSSDEMAA